MANEIQTNSPIGLNLYVVVQNSSGQYWRTDTTVFESLTLVNWASYTISLTETPVGSGFYVASFPSGIVTSGRYTVLSYVYTGSLTFANSTFCNSSYLYWTGTAENTQYLSFTGSNVNANTQAYATGQDPASLVLVTPANKIATDGSNNVSVLASSIASAVWGAAIATYNSAGTFGNFLQGMAASVWSVGTRTLTAFGFNVTVGTNNDKTGYTLTTAEHMAISGTDVPAALTAQGYTTTRSGYLDTLNGLVAAIWSAATRTLSAFGFNVTVGTNNDKSGYSGVATNIPTDYQQRGVAVTLPSTAMLNTDSRLPSTVIAAQSDVTGLATLSQLATDLTSILAAITSATSPLATSSALSTLSTTAGLIKTQTDKMLFDSSNYMKANMEVDSVGIAGTVDAHTDTALATAVSTITQSMPGISG